MKQRTNTLEQQCQIHLVPPEAYPDCEALLRLNSESPLVGSDQQQLCASGGGTGGASGTMSAHGVMGISAAVTCPTTFEMCLQQSFKSQNSAVGPALNSWLLQEPHRPNIYPWTRKTSEA